MNRKYNALESFNPLFEFLISPMYVCTSSCVDVVSFDRILMHVNKTRNYNLWQFSVRLRAVTIERREIKYPLVVLFKLPSFFNVPSPNCRCQPFSIDTRNERDDYLSTVQLEELENNPLKWKHSTTLQKLLNHCPRIKPHADIGLQFAIKQMID